MAKRKTYTDKEIMDACKKFKKASLVVANLGLTLGTLRHKLSRISYAEGKIIKLDGLWDDSKPIKYKKMGISIGKGSLSETSFSEGDTFTLDSFNKSTLTLKKV